MTYLDDDEIRKTINLMKPNNELFEVRIVIGKMKPLSGYFTDAETLIRELHKQNLKGVNVYITLNEPNKACYSRMQKDRFLQEDTTTSDSDIFAYDWLMIDLDPKRPSKVSSTDAEIQLAKDLGNKIYKFLSEKGFEKPLLAMSGNGVHLLYKVYIANSKDRQMLMQNCLKTLHILFSTDEIEVDQKNYNPARVCKLYGTLAQKGLNDAERPHRMSYVVGNPDEIKVTDVQYLEKLVELLPKEPEKPQKYNNYRPSEFNLDDWLDKYGIRYTKKSWNDADKYVLEECPFDSNHKAPDSCIIKFRNGAIAFNCFHNSCAFHTWQDLRMKYEPDAYEKKQMYEERKMFHSYNRNQEPVHIQPKEGKAVFYTAKEIVNRPKQTEQIIKTGIDWFDKKYRGLRKHDVTALSGQSGGAKSTLLSQICLNAVNSGNNVAVFSGELADMDFMRWMNLQAAGKEYTEPSNWEGYYNVPYKYQLKIADWLEGHFWLYNNDYGYNFDAIIEQFEKMIDEHKLDLLCIDNLMALDISQLGYDKNTAQAAFVKRVHELAQQKNVHIIIVCHPKKPTGLLTMYDISGASEIINYVDNIIYIYRVNQSFKNAYKMFYGRDWIEEGTNVWNAAKVRHGSVDESFYTLFYEPETKRLKNYLAENIVYGWKDPEDNKQISMMDDTEFEEIEIPDDIPFE